jgi:D-inositol-3-phosphate glycosyltransferase
VRIAMLSAHSCPVGHLGTKDTGGMSVYIREIASELGKQGHEVDVFTRVHDPRDQLMENLGKNTRLVHLRVGGDEEIHKLVLYSYLPDFALSLEEFRKSNNINYDLVFSHYWLSGQVGRKVCQRWKTPHVIMFHTLGIIKNSLGIGEEEPELRVQTEGDLAHECQRIIATTENEKNILMESYSIPQARIGVVPCGVNLDMFHPIDRKLAIDEAKFLLNEGEKVVLFVGRIDSLKGIDLLIRAIACLPVNNRTKLLIVGGDKESQTEIARLQALSRQLGIEQSVFFLGTVKHDKIPYFYNAADVCVVPSRYESFGLVALESLACGTPVVSTDVGILRNIIRSGETGYVVRDRTPENISNRIAAVLGWPERTPQKAESVRNSVKDFSWANIARQIDTELQTVLTDHLALVH